MSTHQTFTRSDRAAARAALSLLVALVGVAACGGEASESSAGTTERDSVGVTIVENGSLSEWSTFAEIDPAPSIEIGRFDGDPEYQLFRVVSAHRLPDGAIVIANAGTHELRFYGPDGTYRSSVGQEGEGPGEFMRLYRSWVRSDSIWTFDTNNRAFSVFGLDGGFARSYRVGGDDQFGFPNALFSDAGSLVQINRVFRSGEESGGVDRQDMTMTVYGRDGTLESELGTWPGNEMYVVAEEDFMAVRGLTFGRGLYSTVSLDRVVIGTTDTLAFEIRGRDGTLQRLVRVTEPLRPAPSQAWDRVRDDVMESSDEGMLNMWERMFENMPRRETYPAFARFVTDAVGRIWLEDYRAPGDPTRAWSVFSPDGHALGRVRTPDDLTVFEIGTDYVLGVIRDELEVERVRIHPMSVSSDIPLETGS